MNPTEAVRLPARTELGDAFMQAMRAVGWHARMLIVGLPAALIALSSLVALIREPEPAT